MHRAIGPAWTGRGRPPAGYFTKRTAEDWLRDVLAQARAGTLPGSVRTGLTFAEVAAEHLVWLEGDRARKPSTLRGYRSIINRHLVPWFGGDLIENLTVEEIERFKASLTVSNHTKVRILTLLHGILARARKAYGLPSNPAAEVEKPLVRRTHDIEVFSPEEVMALVRAAASEQDAAIYLTAAFTGLRRGELIALRWRDVDFSASCVRVRASYAGDQLTAPKSGRIRSVPMAPQVAEALARLGDRGEFTGDDELVFAGVGGSYLDGSALRRRYGAALRRAGLRPLRFHDLRHTFGTTMIRRADILEVKEWMGHADVDTTMKYLHYVPRADAAARVAEAFAVEPVNRAGAPA